MNMNMAAKLLAYGTFNPAQILRHQDDAIRIHSGIKDSMSRRVTIVGFDGTLIDTLALVRSVPESMSDGDYRDIVLETVDMIQQEAPQSFNKFEIYGQPQIAMLVARQNFVSAVRRLGLGKLLERVPSASDLVRLSFMAPHPSLLLGIKDHWIFRDYDETEVYTGLPSVTNPVKNFLRSIGSNLHLDEVNILTNEISAALGDSDALWVNTYMWMRGMDL